MNYFDCIFDGDELLLTSPHLEKSSLKTFEENIATSFKSTFQQSGLLPAGFIYADETSNFIVFERPPRNQTITYFPMSRASAKQADDDEGRTFTVPLPWQLYVAEFYTNGALGKMRMYFASSECSSFHHVEGTNQFEAAFKDGSQLHFPTLPNVYGDGHFCIDNETSYSNEATLEAKVYGSFNSVWDTVFNADLLDMYNPNLKYASKTLDKLGIKHDFGYEYSFFECWSQLSISQVLENVSMFRGTGNVITSLLDDLSSPSNAAFNNIVGILPQLV